MIEALISSKTRIKLLLKFFLNSDNRAYLRALEQEFGESTNGIRLELNRLEEAGLLLSDVQGNKKYYAANRGHPLFDPVQQLVLRTVGVDQILDKVIQRLGEVHQVYLTGALAKGLDSNRVDLLIIGNPDRNYLDILAAKAEVLIQRQIYATIITELNPGADLLPQPRLLVYQSNIHQTPIAP
jgi:DNA-binding transcriptional ArsR family regulator